MRSIGIVRTIKPIILSHPEIKLVYLFGSRVTGNTGALSDYDFAFYIDKNDTQRLYDLQFKLMDEIGRALRTDKLDIIIFNLTQSPELKYKIIRDGELTCIEISNTLKGKSCKLLLFH